ncbi:hypothetical protein BJ138DRAFT_1138788 [Hygrophoropsis aurantiaca]|uniref:Uncharacterized protein n=1 Tax=Hygrophoropsis aurantiaca TaxID=72124 RepID=A0ACB7ZQT7_9AGAM|nr:hypothetical protein BJ138DRAFT_1138788 [Hygrophoropsis aurantiaca]
MLVSRARASQLTHYYRGKKGMCMPEATSQRYTKGNVAVLPQDAIRVRQFLPPSRAEISESMCTLFTGSSVKPALDNLKKLCPILVSKNRVKSMIDFLVDHNPFYQLAGVQFSEDNFTDLLSDEDYPDGVGIPRGVDICSLAPAVDAVDSCEIDGEPDVDEDIFVESVGYTNGDHSPANRQAMKLRALAHALDKKKFLLSRSGDNFLNDNDPGLMSYLFPHLDPWGIGGFNHSARSKGQLKNLLKQDNSPFAHDANFSFEVNINSAFRVSKSAQHNIAKELSALAAQWKDDAFAKPKNPPEKRAVKILKRINIVAKNLKGSAGYKLARRNEIRSLLKTFYEGVL